MKDLPFCVAVDGTPLKSNGKIICFPDSDSASAYVRMLRRKVDRRAPYEVERLEALERST